MCTEVSLSILVNGIISLSSVIASIIIAKISKNVDLYANHKYNRYISKVRINRKDDTWILKAVDEYPYTVEFCCKKTQRYIMKRYKKIIKQKKKEGNC